MPALATVSHRRLPFESGQTRQAGRQCIVQYTTTVCTTTTTTVGACTAADTDGGQRFSLLLFFIGKRGKRGPPALTSPSAVLTHSLSIDTRTRSLLCSQTEEGGKHTFQAHRQSLNSRKRRKDVRPRPLWFGKEGERERETRPYQSGFVLVGSYSLSFGEKGVALLLRFLPFLFALLLHL